ncbi:hypothetical protein [Streptacidiphilus sp. PAMC 29251]
MNTAFPPGGDREAARRWLRERTPDTRPGPPPTHASLLREQRDRLLSQAGFPPDQEPSGAAKLDLALDGPAVIDHSASISLLGTFFTSLQNLVTAVAQALEGTPTIAGQVAGYITAATQLRSAPAFPSSYGLHLYGPDTAAPAWRQGHLPLDAGEAPPPGSTPRLLPDAVGTLLDITDLAQDQESAGAQEQLLEKLLPLGQRALGHLATFTGVLAQHDASLKMTWQPDSDQARTVSLSTGAALRLKGLSEDVRFSEPDARLLEGELIEASLRRGSVLIQLDSGTTISARTEAAVTPRLRDDLLGKRIEALVQVTVARYAGGRQREIYVVTRIAPLSP